MPETLTLWSESNFVTEKLTLINSENANGPPDDKVASAGTSWDVTPQYWTFVLEDLAELPEAIVKIELVRRGYQEGWVDDIIYVQVSNDEGATWWDEVEWYSSSLSTLVWRLDLTDFNTLAKLNGARIRIRKETVGAQDAVTWHVDAMGIRITYEPKGINYFPNTINCTGYKWTRKLTGNYRGEHPDVIAGSPADIKSTGTVFTSTERDTASTDNDLAVSSVLSNIEAGETGFAAIMLEFTAPEPSSIAEILESFRAHNTQQYTYLHLWDPVNETWGSRLQSIPAGSKLTWDIYIENGKYRDANLKIYVLIWEYGFYTTEAEGCLRDVLIQTPKGNKRISEIRVGDIVYFKEKETLKETRVLLTAKHFGKWKLCKIKDCQLTPEHKIYFDGKWIMAKELVSEFHFYEGYVYDLQTESGSFLSAEGLQIHNKVVPR